MSELSPSDFTGFFESVYDAKPFLWQQRLLDQVLHTGRWPDVIDLPTGVGKTAALDVACFALATAPELFPRRTVFVIDRRLIVDQVLERGRVLAAALANPASGVVEAVSDRLRALSHGHEPLHVAGLRGGVAADNAWARWPDQPSLIVSTVDQIGSRLLFRGYGVSNNMRPVHAGLAGNDCLILLDEVHLSRPFAKTLRSIGALYRPGSALPDRWQVVEMSATPGGDDHGTTVFRLIASDSEPEIEQRVHAKKRAQLVEVGKRSQDAAEAIAAEVKKLLSRLPEDTKTVGVVVNRVRTARAVADLLKQGQQEVPAVALLTGRMRPLDREEVVKKVQCRVDPDREDDANAKRMVAVATQCIEVGADFSFDALVTECAPVDALRQRFGRLDRRGRVFAEHGAPAPAFILGVKEDIARGDDPVYGSALAATWLALRALHGDQGFDVGPLSTDLATGDPHLLAPSGRAPLLLPSHLDAFVQTAPRPAVEPDPAPFLHGLEAERDADVGVVWRADITRDVLDALADGDERLRSETLRSVVSLLDLCPPRAAETMPVPIGAARAWLADQDEVAVADTEISAADTHGGAKRRVLIWRRSNSGDACEVATGNDLRPGCVVIVPSQYGGVTDGNWDPKSTVDVADLGDRAQFDQGARVALRLDQRVLPEGVPAPPTPPSDEDQSKPDDQLVGEWLEAVNDWCRASGAGVPDWLSCSVSHLHEARSKGLRVARIEAPPTYVVTCPRKSSDPTVDAELLDGSDSANSFTGTGITLHDHLNGVTAVAGRFAAGLALPQGVITDLELAAELHDLGKADRRFQLVLHRGDEIAEICATDLLAKSRSDIPYASAASATSPDPYPWGTRHELLSVALAQNCEEVLSRAHDRDLVLHLVASHHGYCRPLPQPVVDPSPRQVALEALGSNFTASTRLGPDVVGVAAAERFWRVVERYGWYGAAWLEAIFRLADHRQSESESQTKLQRTSAGARE